MYDYLHLDCAGTFYRYWLDNDLLDFPLLVSERTGEILQSSREAKDKNLLFRITPSTTIQGHNHCTLTGSIHKHFNDGRHNADTFYLSDFVTEVFNLKTRFDVNPYQTIVKSFEFGINIELPENLKASEVVQSLVCVPTKKFIRMNVKKVKLGKMVHFDDHDLKIYDKSGMVSQHELFNKKRETPSNILRIEVRVNKMRFLEQRRYMLKQAGKPLYLSQLMKHDFTERLGFVLIDLLKEVIFYQKQISTRNLTEKQRTRLAMYQQAHFWETANHKQRYRAKEIMDELLMKCSPNETRETLLMLAKKQIGIILSDKDKNGVRMHNNILPCKYHQKGTFAPLECKVHLSPTPKKRKRKVKKQRFCLCCGKDITHQRANSKYCSEKVYGQQGKQCRNNVNYKTNKLKRLALIEKETALLNRLIDSPPPNKITIVLNTGQTKHPTINQLIAYPWSVRRTIIKLTTNRITLTRKRAKTFVKHLKNTV